MDALALLCTLHADGPRTTRRLRHLGVHTLDALREMPIEELADALESSNGAAERFLREAQILLKRVRHEAVEVTPRKGKAKPAAAPKSAPAPTRAAKADSRPRPLQLPVRPLPIVSQPPTSPPPVEMPAAELTAPLESRVDTPEPAETQDEGRFDPAAEEAAVEESGLQRYVINPLVREVSEPLRVSKVPHLRSDTKVPLRPGLFDGLDDDTCQRLCQSEVESVEDLAQTSGLDLALELNWPYDRVFHLKKEASHYLQTLGKPAPAPVTETNGVSTGGALVEDSGATLGSEDEGAAGPFA